MIVMNPNNDDGDDKRLDLGSPIYPIVSHQIDDDPSLPVLSNASTPSTVSYDLEVDEELPTTVDGTIVLSSGTESNMESQQHSMEVSQTWSPMAISTPVVTTAPPSEKHIENELFHDIEQLIRKFVSRPNCDFPCYRVMRWFEGDDPTLEYVVTVVINQPIVHKKTE